MLRLIKERKEIVVAKILISVLFIYVIVSQISFVTVLNKDKSMAFPARYQMHFAGKPTKIFIDDAQ